MTSRSHDVQYSMHMHAIAYVPTKYSRTLVGGMFTSKAIILIAEGISIPTNVYIRVKQIGNSIGVGVLQDYMVYLHISNTS